MEYENVISSKSFEVEVEYVELPGDVRFYTWFERLFDWLFGCKVHNWSRPFTLAGMSYPRPYNAHENCVDCGKMRFYDTRTMTDGPLFRKVRPEDGVR